MGLGQSKKKNKEEEIQVRNTPHHKRVFGGRGTPVSMAVGTIPKDLQDYLLENSIFHCKTREEFEERGFFHCVDYPELEGHVYYEGYFHSKSTSESINSINPRKGTLFDKPSAPKEVRAFYIAFRNKNKDKLQSISDKIRALDVNACIPLPVAKSVEGMSEEEAEKEKVRHSNREKEYRQNIEHCEKAQVVLADLFDQREEAKYKEMVVSDLAIQVHYGDGVNGDQLGWHYDAINSIFHLALSIHGSRDLYCYVADTDGAKECPLNVDKLNIGDAYVSSPYLFRHAVEYPQQTWEKRTIAIQARFLLTDELAMSIYRLEQGFKTAVAYSVSDVIETGFEYPNLNDVQSISATLS